MLYKKMKPSALLIPFVDSYFFWEDEDIHLTPLEVESPPSGYTAFVFNYGDVYEVCQQGLYSKTTPAFMAGQATSNYKLSLRGRIAMAGIVFKPAAISSIFGFSLEDFTKRREIFNENPGR